MIRLLLVLGLFAGKIFPAFGAEEMVLPPLVKDLNSVTVPPNLKEAELHARVACSMCHVYPEPSLLPKSVWNEHVLPKMKLYLGIELLDADKTPEGHLFKASGLFPDAARVPKQNWPAIAGFYLTQAPDKLAPISKPPIPIGLKHFSVERPAERRGAPITPAIRIQADEKVIFSGDVNIQGINVFTHESQHLTEIKIRNIPTAIQKVGEYLYVGAIGHFFPREERRGQLIAMQITDNGLIRTDVMSGLPRVAHLEPADFNGDGKIDLAVSMFGYLTGRLSLFEGSAPEKFTEHVITNRSGAVQSAAYDFDNDGDKDLAALFGQEWESLLIYHNDGKGRFAPPVAVFTKPSSYGHAAFDLADFNKDGRMDFVVANGDNGDYESPPKPYHGIRIYLDEGNGKYAEKYFYPMYGAFGVKARDFDLDGDIDLACTSFFPDYTTNPRDSFVFLEQTAPFQFSASTFRECISGRWITLDAGDVDGDGDEDVALASLVRMPTKIPRELTQAWEAEGPSMIVLRNKTRTSVSAPLTIPGENSIIP